MNAIVRLLLRVAEPFKLGHIYNHLDGELYMERFALFETKYLSMRLHHIVREDRDRHLHDHPWDFASIVLGGNYTEVRPIASLPSLWRNGQEMCRPVERKVGSIAFRRASDRHMITRVSEGTWTLFITGMYRNKWGFFTPAGKVPYREYLGLPPKEGQEP